jgi:hypothetical protein
MDEAALAATLRALDERTRAIAEVVDALRPLLPLVAQAPALLATVGDSFDDIMRRAAEHGIDVERGVLNGTSAALRFGATMDAEKVRELQALLDSGVFAPNVLKIIGELGRALTDTAVTPPPAVGVFGLLKAMADPDVQRALGFLITFAERFGARLGQPSRPTRGANTQGALP